MLLATEGQLLTEKGNPPEDGINAEDLMSADYHHLHAHSEFEGSCWKCKEEVLQESHENAEASYDFEDEPL